MEENNLGGECEDEASFWRKPATVGRKISRS
jgi:hypothetical protein